MGMLKIGRTEGVGTSVVQRVVAASRPDDLCCSDEIETRPHSRRGSTPRWGPFHPAYLVALPYLYGLPRLAASFQS
jgi:hypothetical protein